MVKNIKAIFFTSVLSLFLSTPFAKAEPSAAGELAPENAAEATGESPKVSEAVQQKFLSVRKEIQDGTTGNVITASQSNQLTSKKATGLFFKMIFGMVFIIILIILSIRWLKSLQKSSLLGKKRKTTGKLEVLETCYLGKDQKVVLVNMGDKEVALGVTSGNIQFLKEMGESVSKEKTVALGQQNPEMENFRDNLNGFLSKYKRPKTVSQTLQEL